MRLTVNVENVISRTYDEDFEAIADQDLKMRIEWEIVNGSHA